MSNEPTKVFIAILLPRTISAAISKTVLIAVRINPGVLLINDARITDIPLVPPNSNDFGKIKSMTDRQGYHMTQVDYAQSVTAVIVTDDDRALTDEITDLTSGRASVIDVAPVVYAVIDGEVHIME